MLSTLRAWTETFHTRCTSVGNLGPTRFAKSQSSLGHTFPMFRTARKLFFSFSCWFYRILGGQTWPENRWFLSDSENFGAKFFFQLLSWGSESDLHNGMKHDTFCWKIILLYTHIGNIYIYIIINNQKWFTTHYQISHMICNQQSRIYNGKPKLRGQETAPTLATMNPRIVNKQPVLVINPWLLAVSHLSGGW